MSLQILAAHGLLNKDYVVIPVSSNTTAIHKRHYAADTKNGVFNLTLPEPALPGFSVIVSDVSMSFDTNNLTVVGSRFRGTDGNYIIDTKGAVREFIWEGSEIGWMVR